MKRLALLATALLGLAAAPPASAVAPVAFLKAYATAGCYPDPGFAVAGFVEVQNIAYAKKVTVVVRGDGGPWREVPATYFAPTHDGLEAWYFTGCGPREFPASFEFYARYEVAGRTYWDSNGGRNYRLSVDPAAGPSLLMGSATVLLAHADARLHDDGGVAWPWLQGDVYVKNLAYEKVVRIVYSVDEWRTVQSAYASYAGPADGVTATPEAERWKFAIRLPLDTQDVRFAVEYRVNGISMWDNDFGPGFYRDTFLDMPWEPWPAP